MVARVSFVLLVLNACGSTKAASLAVDNAAALAPCTKTNEAQVAFVEDDGSVRICHGDAWIVFDLTGPTGAQGSTGASGVKGASGKDGKDASVSGLFASSIGCNGQLENTTLWFSYSAGIMKSGDVIATGSIRDAYFEVAKTAFYSNAQVGAATGTVILTNDVQGTANAGYWSISVNRTSLVTSIVYNDADVSGGTASWTMTPDKCVANTYF